MAKRPSGKKLTANELFLQKLKEMFERNENVIEDCNRTNIWVILVATEPFSDLSVENLSYTLTDQKPTHRAVSSYEPLAPKQEPTRTLTAPIFSSPLTSNNKRRILFGKTKASGMPLSFTAET